MTKKINKIAIIGAGLSGTNCAYHLAKIADVTIFEKSRGFGGRMSTKLIEGTQFDHGLQFFTAKTKAFQHFMDQLENKSIVKSWNANFVEIHNKKIIQSRKWNNQFKHFIGIPKMSSICRYLACGIDVKLNATVTRINKDNGRWKIYDEHSYLGVFDWIIFAIPVHQIFEILPQGHNLYPEVLYRYNMLPCFALMASFRNRVNTQWEAALVKNSILSWISINSSKCYRESKYSIVALSTNMWAQENIDKAAAFIQEKLFIELQNIIQHGLDIIDISIHKWRYANARKQYGPRYIMDSGSSLAICGDWFIKGVAEGAFLSSMGLADELSAHLSCC